MNGQKWSDAPPDAGGYYWFWPGNGRPPRVVLVDTTHTDVTIVRDHYPGAADVMGGFLTHNPGGWWAGPIPHPAM